MLLVFIRKAWRNKKHIFPIFSLILLKQSMGTHLLIRIIMKSFNKAKNPIFHFLSALFPIATFINFICFNEAILISL